MVENSKFELDADEEVEKYFIVRNRGILKRIIDIFVDTAFKRKIFGTNDDYPFFYEFIITSKRVFILSLRYIGKVVSYEIYNRDDIKVLADRDRGNKLSMFCYICGLVPFILIAGFLFKVSFVNRELGGCILVEVCMLLIGLSLHKLRKFIGKSKLSITVSKKDNKKLYCVLKTEKQLEFFKKI